METLTARQIEELERLWPGIPKGYLEWLSESGWGESESGYMIYSGPAQATEVFGSECPERIKKILLIGDDMAGYSIGYIRSSSEWQLVGIDSCGWEVEEISVGLRDHLKS